MSAEMRPYVVRQGDYLTKLAFIHGFDAEEVWNDAKNDEIRGRRGDHHVLAPGDIIYIPVKAKQGLPIVKGSANRYRAKVPKVEVVLVFMDGDRPLASEQCEVRGLGEIDSAKPFTTDDDGKLTLDIPVTTREVSVIFPKGEGMAFQFHIGDMDPVSEPSGVKKRLCNLGHLPGYFDDTEEDSELLKKAITDFQSRWGLQASGEVDEATREELLKRHQA